MKDQWQWSNRNRHFNTPVLLLKSLKCRFIGTTHLKADKKYVPKVGGGKELQITGYHPDWVSTTPGMMFQKVSLERSHHPDTEEVKSGPLSIKPKVRYTSRERNTSLPR